MSEPAPIQPDRAALLRACEIMGGQAAMAAALGLADRRTVWPWFNTEGRRVPEEYCAELERLTSLRGQPVLSDELRPDVRWARVVDASWPNAHGRPCVDVARPAAQAA